MKQEPNIDVVDLGDGRFVLISENRLNFVSDIKDGDLFLNCQPKNGFRSKHLFQAA